MSYDHLKKGLKAFEVHVDILEREANTLKRCNEALRKDNEMLRRILNNRVEGKWSVIEGGMSEQSIKTMLKPDGAA